MDFINSLKRPFIDLKKLFFGLVFTIIPVLNFFSLGFILQSAKLTLKKKNSLPQWNNFKDLFIDGIYFFIINVIYFIPAMLFLGIFYLIGVGIFSKYLSLSQQLNYLFYLSLPIILFTILADYLLPVGLINYIKKREFSASFHFKSIFKIRFTVKYFLNWLVGTLTLLLIILIFALIPYVGIYFGIFIGGMFFFTFIAHCFRNLN